ncbi:hypothetical protein WEI85_00450 [Actinomycetes bacterium KLBMP 9797]
MAAAHRNRPAGTGAGSPNPADDSTFRRQLHQHVDALANTVRLRPPHQPPADRHQAEQQRQQIAAAWVYMSCVVAWAEDHGLVRPLLRSSPDGLTRTPASGVLWLARAFEQLAVHPSTQWLMHPAYQPMLWAGAPSSTASTTLIDWWASKAPYLAYPATGSYPASIGGWPIGDLLQVLSPQRRTRDALVQTPHWVAELILDQTVMRAADEFRDEELLRTIDPACGTGHFLILAVDYLWQWWTTGTITAHAVKGRPPITGGIMHPPAEAIRRILASVDGVEIDPMTAAVARFRMTVYIGHLMERAGLIPSPLRLSAIPPTITPRVAVGDALLLGKVSRAEYAQLHPHLADLPGAAFPLPDFAWPAGETPAAATRRRRTR